MPIRVPYVPTPEPVARKMLELANAGPGDIVYDLGCGDGRILFIALREFNVSKAVCVELREDLVQKVREEAKRLSLMDRLIILHKDMFEVDVSDATIVTLFLLTSVNDELAPKLERELRNGARIVSHEFQISRWRPLVYATVYDGQISHNIYLYVKGYSDRV